ncbi:hypothetical protein JCM10450v2_001012 [Rhodotorula kratochvilovae]
MQTMGKDLERFTVPLPDHLHCPVCLAAAYPPIAVCSAEHILCQSCITALFAATPAPSCPACREMMPPQLKASPGLKRAIEGYNYKCFRGGCDWVGTVDLEEAHNSVCPYRMVDCALCEQPYQANQKAAHEAECPSVLLDCPRGGRDCGGTKNGGRRKRCNMRNHDRHCTQYKCSVPGCETRTTTLNLCTHEPACRRLHDELAYANDTVKLVSDGFKGVSTQLRSAKHALVDFRRTHEEVKNGLKADLERLTAASKAAAATTTTAAGRAARAAAASSSSSNSFVRRSTRVVGFGSLTDEPAAKKQKKE